MLINPCNLLVLEISTHLPTYLGTLVDRKAVIVTIFGWTSASPDGFYNNYVRELFQLLMIVLTNKCGFAETPSIRETGRVWDK